MVAPIGRHDGARPKTDDARDVLLTAEHHSRLPWQARRDELEQLLTQLPPPSDSAPKTLPSSFVPWRFPQTEKDLRRALGSNDSFFAIASITTLDLLLAKLEFFHSGLGKFCGREAASSYVWVSNMIFRTQTTEGIEVLPCNSWEFLRYWLPPRMKSKFLSQILSSLEVQGYITHQPREFWTGSENVSIKVYELTSHAINPISLSWGLISRDKRLRRVSQSIRGDMPEFGAKFGSQVFPSVMDYLDSRLGGLFSNAKVENISLVGKKCTVCDYEFRVLLGIEPRTESRALEIARTLKLTYNGTSTMSICFCPKSATPFEEGQKKLFDIF